MILHQWLVSYSAFLNIHRSGVLWRCLIVKWLVPRETAAFLACSLYTIQPCTVSRYFMQSHIRRVHACLVVTCHLHFWQNDRDLLHATAVTQGWIEGILEWESAQKVDPGEENSPATPAVHFFKRGNAEGTNSSQICIWCLCRYVLFYVCTGIGFVEWHEKRLVICEKSFEIQHVCLWWEFDLLEVTLCSHQDVQI